MKTETFKKFLDTSLITIGKDSKNSNRGYYITLKNEWFIGDYLYNDGNIRNTVMHETESLKAFWPSYDDAMEFYLFWLNKHFIPKINNADPQNRIVCSAIRKYGEVILGARHCDSLMHNTIKVYKTSFEEGISDINWSNAEQGFVDRYGNFLNRKEAFKVAFEAGQIVRMCGSEHSLGLCSENLY